MGLGVGGKQTGLEACEMGFFPMKSFGVFWGCQLFWNFRLIPKDVAVQIIYSECHVFPWMHFSMLSSGGVNMWVEECAQSPEQFGDGTSGRS